ncbi:MAG: hypothetical protein ACR2LI_01830 [Propionibacteriaceae bacterium]
MKSKQVRGRLEAARDQIMPAAEDAYHSAADRVGPLVHSAADHVGPWAHSAAEHVGPWAQSAAERVAPYTQAAVDKVQPWASLAADKAGQAVDVAQPYVHDASERLSPYVHDAADRLTPLAHGAKVRGAAAAATAVGVLGPKLDDALERVPPAVEAAREKLSEDYLPRLATALSGVAASAAATPVGQEALKRGEATLAAVKGELEPPRKKKKGNWLLRIALIAGLVAAIAVVAKKLLASDDPGWQSATPSAAPTPSSNSKTAPAPVVTPAPAADLAPAADPGPAADPVAEPAAVAEPSPVPSDEATKSTESTESTETTDATDDGVDSGLDDSPLDNSPIEGVVDDPNPFRYGEGSFIGVEPPEGYTIKGNERSMKYHLPESPAWGRTHAEVWFNSTDAAESAGFVRAQR